MAVAIAVTLAAASSATGQVRFLATPIGKGTTALGINAYGDVVGSVVTPAGKRAFLWSDGTLQLLGTLGGANSGATAISDRREVVGEAETPSGETHAFLWRHGAMQDLGALPGHRNSFAAAVDNFGRVVGTSYVGDTSSAHRAFLHDGWSMIDLGTLGGRDSRATAINDWGQVVGDASDGNETRAFLYANGVMVRIGAGVAPANSGAVAINANGHVAGYQNYFSIGGFFTSMWLYAAGVQEPIGCPMGRCFPAGINRRDQVVGYAVDATGALSGAFLWDAATGGVALTVPGWTLTWARAINDRGQVVAQGCNSEGCQGVRLEPVATVLAVEFLHAGYGHYFVTVNPDEIASLDNGTAAGWQRTGKAFEVWRAAAAGLEPVCRFWSGQSFAPKSSHFYTPYVDECAKVKLDPVWSFEGIAFFARMPVGALGARTCSVGTQPLYRAYNDGKGGAPNHRYTTDPVVLDEMIAKGWIMEGEAATRVFACVPLQE
jgi:probable HAF family extracellular repeat protein